MTTKQHARVGRTFKSERIYEAFKSNRCVAGTSLKQHNQIETLRLVTNKSA